MIWHLTENQQKALEVVMIYGPVTLVSFSDMMWGESHVRGTAQHSTATRLLNKLRDLRLVMRTGKGGAAIWRITSDGIQNVDEANARRGQSLEIKEAR